MRFLVSAQLVDHLTLREREFVRLGLSEASREEANQVLWDLEAAACIAWALRLVPRIWPMDEQFDGEIDEHELAAPERRFVEIASLRSSEEIQAACEKVKFWHWRARQLALEKQGLAWPPKEANAEVLADLRAKGLDTLHGLVRATTRQLREQGILDETVDDDFVAKGRPYSELSADDAGELMNIAAKRHRALNWLCGLAPSNDWDSVPLET